MAFDDLIPLGPLVAKYLLLAVGPILGALLLWVVGTWIIAGFRRLT
jgi:hypothetical protein